MLLEAKIVLLEAKIVLLEAKIVLLEAKLTAGKSKDLEKLRNTRNPLKIWNKTNILEQNA